MRHHKSGRKLNRTSSHRHAMFRNMAASLIHHEEIRTTLPKAKELRRVAEPLITLAKVSSVANRRLAFSRLRDRQAVGKLFDVLGVRYKDRPGGYLRILKFGYRAGDTAPMALVQLIDRPEPGTAAAQSGATAKPESVAKPATTAAKAKKPAKAATTKAAAAKTTKKSAPKTKKAAKKATKAGKTGSD